MYILFQFVQEQVIYSTYSSLQPHKAVIGSRNSATSVTPRLCNILAGKQQLTGDDPSCRCCIVNGRCSYALTHLFIFSYEGKTDLLHNTVFILSRSIL